MFCQKCGKNLPDTAKFCDTCGKTTSTAPSAVATDSGVTELSFNNKFTFGVAAQGFTPDLSAANGSYDPIELGTMNPEQLYKLLERIKHLQTPAPTNPSQDICPASVTVTLGDDIHAFEMAGGSIIYSNANTVISAYDAANIVTGRRYDHKSAPADTKDTQGKKYSSARQWGSDHPDVKGLTPVRKRNILPTDRVNTGGSSINTKTSPQIQATVVKSRSSAGYFIAPLAFSVFTVALALGGFAMDEPEMAVICFVLTVLLFLLAWYLRKRARGGFRLGFDWATNTVWAKQDSKQMPSYLGNANCITGFRIEKTKLSATRYARIGNSTTPIATRVRDDYYIWYLLADKTDGSAIPLCTLYSEKDALTVQAQANALLSQQI
jgi:hypothetical protein